MEPGTWVEHKYSDFKGIRLQTPENKHQFGIGSARSEWIPSGIEWVYPVLDPFTREVRFFGRDALEPSGPGGPAPL